MPPGSAPKPSSSARWAWGRCRDVNKLMMRRTDGPVAGLAPRVRVAGTTAELDALADAWTELLAALPEAMLSQTWRYARTAWTAIHEPRGRRLAVVTVWQGEQLDLVW